MNNPVEKDDNDLQTWFESYHSGELIKLNRILKHFSGFHFVLIEHNNPMYRDKLIQHIKNMQGSSCRMNVNTESFPDFSKFEENLLKLRKRNLSFVNIVPDDRWFKGDEGKINLRGFNMHRELIAENCPFLVLLWMTGDDINAFVREAPDMWAWRTAVSDFTLERSKPLTEDRFPNTKIDLSSAEEKKRMDRIKEIESFLDKEGAPIPDRQRALLTNELGNIYRSIGLSDKAHELFKVAFDIYDSLNDRLSKALAMGNIADILSNKGKVDEALKLHQDSLTVYEELGDRREKALTLGGIARILVFKGQVDEALKLYQDMLTVFEDLGDRRSQAVTLGDIARIQVSKGQVDEALKLHHEMLTVFEDLGDRRSQAVTLGDIARIQVSKGQVDEALKLHHEMLTVFEDLGDRHSRAVTLGDIARIQVFKGQVDEPMQLYHEMLMVFEDLGYLDGKASALFGMAKIELQSGKIEKGLEHLKESYSINLNLGRLERISVVGVELGNILCKTGDMEQGIGILRRSHDGFHQLGQEKLKNQVKEMIKKNSESPKPDLSE